MERKEAVELLKELIEKNLAEPSFISIEKNDSGRFNLVMKDECNSEELKEFVTEKKLTVKIDEQKGYCVIHKSEP